MKKHLRRFFEGGRSRAKPLPRRLVHRYTWGHSLVTDDGGNWRGLVRLRGPNGKTVVLVFCPHAGRFVDGETRHVPIAELVRLEKRLALEQVSFGAEVRA